MPSTAPWTEYLFDCDIFVLCSATCPYHSQQHRALLNIYTAAKIYHTYADHQYVELGNPYHAQSSFPTNLSYLSVGALISLGICEEFDLSTLDRLDKSGYPDLSTSVNLSAQQFYVAYSG